MLDDRTEDLIQRHLEQVATAADLAELDRLVCDRSEVADALWEAARVDALLSLHLQGVVSAGANAVVLKPSGVRGRRLVWAAAAAMLLVATMLWWSPRSPTGQVAQDSVPALVTESQATT